MQAMLTDSRFVTINITFDVTFSGGSQLWRAFQIVFSTWFVTIHITFDVTSKNDRGNFQRSRKKGCFL